jgi:hypothetical protein
MAKDLDASRPPTSALAALGLDVLARCHIRPAGDPAAATTSEEGTTFDCPGLSA